MAFVHTHHWLCFAIEVKMNARAKRIVHVSLSMSGSADMCGGGRNQDFGFISLEVSRVIPAFCWKRYLTVLSTGTGIRVNITASQLSTRRLQNG